MSTHPPHTPDAAGADTGEGTRHMTPEAHAHAEHEDRGLRVPPGAIAFVGLALSLLATVAAGSSKAGALDERVQSEAAAQIDAGKRAGEQEARLRALEEDKAATAEHLRHLDTTLTDINKKLDAALNAKNH